MKKLLRLLKSKLPKDYVEYIVILCIFAYAIIFSYFTIARHYSFDSAAWDLGYFEQMFWTTVNRGTLFRGTPDPLTPSGYCFGVHFSPILFLVLPIYAFCQTTETLLVLQSFVLALGAFPVYWLARDELNSKVAGATFSLAYLLYPPIHGVNWFDFHTEAFIPVLFAFTFFYFKKEKWTGYFIFLFLLLSVTESISPMVICMAFYGLWTHKGVLFKSMKMKTKDFMKDKVVLISFITIILAVLWLVVALRIVYYFNPSRLILRLDRFGPNVPSAILNILSNPIYALRVMFTPTQSKLFYIVGLFGPLMFLSFLDPPSLSMATPWIVISLLSATYHYWTPVGFQYPAIGASIVFISAIYGIKRMMNYEVHSKRPNGSPNVYINSVNVDLKRILVTIIIVSVLFSVLMSPLGIDSTIGISGRPSGSLYNETLRGVLRLIPLDASVSTQNNIFPHLSRRLNVYPYAMPNVEYILVDKRSSWSSGFIPSNVPHNIPSFDELISELVSNGSIGLLCAVDGIYLFKKGYVGSPVPINTSNHGLWAKFYQDPQLTGLFADSNWGTFNGATEEWYVDVSNVSVAKLDAENETCVQLNTTLPQGKYVVSVKANDTNQVTNDFRFGIWNSEDQKWHTSRTTTLSPSFNIHELEFEITGDDVNKQICFLAMKETAISNTIYVDWASIKPLDSASKTVVLNINWNWFVYSPFPGMIKAESYGIIFEGYLYAPQTGDYTFILHSDDSSRLYVDDEIVIKNSWELSFVDKSTTVHLGKGFHKLRIHYANFYDIGYIGFSWITPWSKEVKIVSYKYLYLTPQETGR